MLYSRANLIAGPAPDLTGALLDMIDALIQPDAMALFVSDRDAWRLVSADCITQADMEVLGRLLERERETLASGLQVVPRRQPDCMIIPALSSGVVIGILLVRPVPDPGVLPRPWVPTLVTLLGRGLDECLGRVSVHAAPPSQAQLDAAEREQLLGHLVRNEWNISRVARVLGVTRMTVYNRMHRYKFARERVYKTRKRRAKRRAEAK